MDTPCAQCGDIFKPRDHRQRFCRPRCKSGYYRNSRTENCTEPGCGKPQRAKGLCSTHYKREYCPDPHSACRRTVPCATCGVPCEAYHDSGQYLTARRRFCSTRCRSSYGKVLVHVGPSWPHTDLPPQHPVRRPPPRGSDWWKLIVAGSCAWCDEYFVGLAAYSGGAPRYCSTACLNMAGKYRHGRFLIAPSKRLAIYERDGWICQLCREPVDGSLPSSDPWGPTLDHIECQSWVLIPDHSPKNLRLAHRWCNSVRGARQIDRLDAMSRAC